MEIDEQIAESTEFSLWAADLSKRLPLADSSRNRIVVLLFEQCLEHHFASMKLMSLNCYGSAFALMRPTFEAYIRGMWFAHCATDKAVDQFITTSKVPRIAAILDDLRGSQCNLEIDGDMHADMWSWMNDYIHGGSLLVKIRFGSRLSKSDRSLDALCLSTTRRWAALALVAMCGLCKEIDLAAQVNQRYLATSESGGDVSV